MTAQLTRIKDQGTRARLFRTRWSLEVVQGVDRGRSLTTAAGAITVGTAEQNELALTDPAVSRHHVRVELSEQGFEITDLGSTNGTRAGHLRVDRVVAEGPVDLSLGDTVIRLSPLSEQEEVPLADTDRFGEVLGVSPSMRELFRRLRAVSQKDVTVLLEGETGTGKELVARELHRHSARKDRPFVVVDCGAIPPTLIETELFGHTRGAFTGAASDRPGALEEADGGTLFLDEIGELELAMQPRLLRALEQREVKRVGAREHKKIDVRVIAASHRDLLRSINAGTFRSDLFYRLAVVHLRIPALRQRPEDVSLIVASLLPPIAERLTQGPPPALSAETMQQLVRHPWPGNVRELRNFLERLVALSADPSARDLAPVLDGEAPSPRRELGIGDLEELPFREAKAKWIEQFDEIYLSRLLERTEGNVAEAARQSGIDRVHLFRLIKKYRLRER